jgi:hypothetical protein
MKFTMEIGKLGMWPHFDGKAYTREEFAAHIEALTWTDWDVEGITLHNTAAPTLAQWAESGPSHDARIRNLQSYYENELGWHAGPHLFISRTRINGFANILLPGVHSRCFNSTHIGIECVGDYTAEAWDSGDGALVRDNAVFAMAVIYRKLGLDPDDLTFHKECTRDNHDCPGHSVHKDDVITRVKAMIVELDKAPPKPKLQLSSPPLTVPPPTDLASKIIGGMLRTGHRVDTNHGECNIIYVEGINPDGTRNDNQPNVFNDLRCVIRFENGKPVMAGSWEATTTPGTYWTEHRMNPDGAFLIALGQQTCWTMGWYHDNEALVQSAPITGTRDDEEDYKREGAPVCGNFGVHHHGGYNYPHDDLGRSSAGCQVGRTVKGHAEFIAILKTDPRYLKNHEFVWTSTVLTADQVLGAVPKLLVPAPIVPFKGNWAMTTEAMIRAGAGAARTFANAKGVGNWVSEDDCYILAQDILEVVRETPPGPPTGMVEGRMLSTPKSQRLMIEIDGVKITRG